MPDLIALLKNQDLKFLRTLADLWNVPAKGADKRAFAVSLAGLMPEQSVFDEFCEGLSVQAIEALKDLKQGGGQQAWSGFTRKYGDLRPMGPAKRDREQPWHFPVSATEALYYRGLIGRDFIRVEDELLEVAYVPGEFLSLLPEVPAKESLDIQERLKNYDIALSDAQCGASLKIVDDYCTLFAALRLGEADPLLAKTGNSEHYWCSLRALGDDLGLLGRDGLPTDLARVFLEKPRNESFAWLISNWANTRQFNELRLMPTLRCEGGWQNRPLPTRRKLLSLLNSLAIGCWYRLDDFVTFLEETEPDFLRQGADYDVWMIYSRESGALLRGIKSWAEVEAEFLRFFITEWMYWLGLSCVFEDETGQLYFSLTPGINILADPSFETEKLDATELIISHSDGLIEMSDKTPPIARYQVARFAEWLELGPKKYRFQLTPSSLTKAERAGLSVRHLLGLLRKYGKNVPPPALIKMLNRWQEHGGEARVEELTVLKLKSPEILQALKDSDAKTWLGESLGPVTVVLKKGGTEKVRASLARLGYLCDIDLEA